MQKTHGFLYLYFNPKYAEFERLLRKIILIILTKAYGLHVYNETVTRDLENRICAKTKGNKSISDTIENMDYQMLEDFLFAKRSQDFMEIFNTSFSREELIRMEKSDICDLIEKIRPKSLWERNFESIGAADKWEKEIKGIHETRNKVAHNKSIKKEEFVEVNKKINYINKNLKSVVTKLIDENYTEIQAIDIIGNFSSLVLKILKSVVISKDFTAIQKPVSILVE